MTISKLFFHTNIRLLRDRKKMSQKELCKNIDIARSKLQALESGKTLNPAMVDVVKFSEYFKISVDSLLKVELGKLGEQKLRELLAGNDGYMTGSNIRVLAITVDNNNDENAEYVPKKARMGYRTGGYSDPEFIARLPKFSLPNLPKSGTYRMFPAEGDSMLPIPEDSEIIASYVEDWKTIKKDTPCVVVLKGQDFVFKLTTIEPDGSVLLKSLNPLYEPYQVSSEDVLEIWKYYRHQTATLPSAPTDTQELKILILDLKKSLESNNANVTGQKQ